jgi:3-oxoacyl-(acyl-carrier-protein) synthase
MHGTGTPLGDPIEVGAAAAALGSATRTLQLSAAKSLMGHAEPAAGTVGIVHASEMLNRVSGSMFPHLRTPNPHVVSVLAGQLPLPLLRKIIIPAQSFVHASLEATKTGSRVELE